MIKKYLRKFSEMSAAKKSALVFMLASYIHYGISFLVTPLFSRLLPVADFGIVSTYNSWVEMLGPIATLSLYAGYFNVGMIHYEDERNQFVSSMIGLSTVSTTIVMAVVFVVSAIAPNIIGLPNVLIVFMGIYFFTSPAVRYWKARERFELKYKKLFWYTVVTALLSPALGVILVLLSKNDLASARAIGTQLPTVAMGIFLFVTLSRRGKTFFDKEKWITALKFALPLVPHYLAMHVLSASDKVMISNMISDSAAGIYGMAYTASMIITSAWTAINGSLNPYMLGKIKERDFKPMAKVSTLCIVGFSGLCLIVCLVAPEVILVLGGDKYRESIALIPPLLASVLFMEMYNLFSTVEFYHKKTFLVMVATVAAAILNLVMNFVFIKLCGYQAAAYTTLVCYILYCLFHYLNMRHIEKEKIYNAKLLLGFSALYVAACFLCLLIYDLPIIRYSILLVMLITGAFVAKKYFKKRKEKE